MDILIVIITFPYSTCISSFFGRSMYVLVKHCTYVCAAMVNVILRCVCLCLFLIFCHLNPEIYVHMYINMFEMYIGTYRYGKETFHNHGFY